MGEARRRKELQRLGIYEPRPPAKELSDKELTEALVEVQRLHSREVPVPDQFYMNGYHYQRQSNGSVVRSPILWDGDEPYLGPGEKI